MIKGTGTKFGWMIYLTILAGCSSGGPGGDEIEQGPTVTPQSCTENCGDITNGDTPRILSLDSPVTVSVSQGERRVFEVPSGAEVSVLSTNGDVELLLFDEVADIDFDNLYAQSTLCQSTGWRVKEDNCTAEGSDSDVYAVVDSFYGDSTFNITATNDCSVEAVNQWVYRNMQDYYLYADQVPVVNPNTYANSFDLVRDLRFEELDPFSSIGDAAVRSLRLEEGIGFGFGYGWQWNSNEQLRLTYVYDDSPFGRAGLKRGDIAVSINGESLDDMPDERFSEIIGDIDNPLSVTWEFIDGDTAQIKTETLRMAQYQINTILDLATYTNTIAPGVVAYIAFKSFLETSGTELDTAINFINSRNANDLVLDLRYNGGGRASIGRRFASQIGGRDLTGQTHSRFKHNSNYTNLDYEEEFIEALPELGLDRLIVLTSERTASASERLINSLRPYMEVITLGSQSRGKPFRSSSKLYCGLALSAMDSQGVNASDVSVAGGIVPDCYAQDNTSQDFGNGSGSVEGMLDTALNYAFLGTCLSQPFTKHPVEPGKEPSPVLDTYEQRIYGDDY